MVGTGAAPAFPLSPAALQIPFGSRPEPTCPGSCPGKPPRNGQLRPRASARVQGVERMPQKGTSSQLSCTAPGRWAGSQLGSGLGGHHSGEGSRTRSVPSAQSCPQPRACGGCTGPHRAVHPPGLPKDSGGPWRMRLHRRLRAPQHRLAGEQGCAREHGPLPATASARRMPRPPLEGGPSCQSWSHHSRHEARPNL